MRKHYLDNIRTIVILLLFPYHTFIMWNKVLQHKYTQYRRLEGKRIFSTKDYLIFS